jgi:hypothetical protein
MPNVALPVAPPATSFAPCWFQAEPERVNTHAAPLLALSLRPPTSAVPPSAESATLEPKAALPAAPLPVSLLPCWLQVEPERVKIHAAPLFPSSPEPPTSAVVPSAESATLNPNRPGPVSPPPVSLSPCGMSAPTAASARLPLVPAGPAVPPAASTSAAAAAQPSARAKRPCPPNAASLTRPAFPLAGVPIYEPRRRRSSRVRDSRGSRRYSTRCRSGRLRPRSFSEKP